MINKLSDAKIALNNIEELKREINAKEKNNNIESNYFYDVALIQTNDEITYNFNSIDRSILNVTISCGELIEGDYQLTVKNNGSVVFSEKYYGKREIITQFSCIMSESNCFQISIGALQILPIKINVNMVGKFNNLLKRLSFLSINTSENIYSLTHFGNYSILTSNNSLSELVENNVNIGDKFIEPVDMKMVKIGESNKALILAKGVVDNYLCQYKVEENYPNSAVLNQSFSDATIIPVNNINFNYIIAVALDGSVQVNYYLNNFTLDSSSFLRNINHVNKIDCAVDLEGAFNHIILSYIDKSDNCYLCGMCNCKSDFGELELNTEKIFVGKGKQVNCYLSGNQIILYLNDGYNNITKNIYSIAILGGGYYLKKELSKVFRNTDQIFLVGGKEVLLKNGVYRINE